MSDGSAGQAPAAFVVPALDNTFGVMVIGIILSSALWGVGTAQMYWYYDTCWGMDSSYIKSFVALVWVFDTIHQALIGHLIYYFLIQNFFNPLALDNYIWSLNTQSLFESLTCVAVQLFFVRRIWKLSRGSYIRTIIPTLPVLAKFGLSLAYFGKSLHLKSITLAFTEIHDLSVAINATAAVGDIVIAATMLHLLYTSRSGFSPTDSMVNRLMAYTVNTGLITSLCAILSLITALAYPKNFIYSVFYFMTGRLYLNTMLASLNARNNLAFKGTVVSGGSSSGGATDIDLPRFRRKVEVETTFTAATRTDSLDGNTVYDHGLSSKKGKRNYGDV